MERMKRAACLLLALIMVVGLLPMGALAEENGEDTGFISALTKAVQTYASGDVIDAAIFCSDVHGSSSDLTSVLGGVAKSGVDYSAIGFVGDTCLTVANTTSIVQSTLDDTNIAVMFSYASSHDTEDGADINENWDYSGEVEGVSDNYLVYTIRETDMQNTSGASTAAPAFTTWYNGLSDAQKALPIFIMSHRPLHDRRDDNAGAPTWYSAISAAAKTSDIVFFWAHNHTSESDVDTAAYYVEKNGTETITVYNGDTVVPNFTYMNAGYINANNQNPARLGIATTVKIYDDALVFQDYNSSGAYSGTYAHNVEVTREFASGSDSGETTDPTEGETTTETKEVYVLTDKLTNNGEYLIVNTNVAGSGYAMNHSSGTEGAVAVDIQESGDYIYIDLDDSTAVWTATTKSSGFELMNGSYFLEAYGSTSAIEISTTQAYSGRYWTYDSSTNDLSYDGGTGDHSIQYADSAFSSTKDGAAIYIYEKQTITVSSDGTVSGGGSTEGGDSGDDDTTGGSTETVVGEGTYTTADDGSYQKVSFKTTTTGTETQTVYVLSSGNPSGNVLIANSATAGSVNLVANDGGDLSNTTTTVLYGDVDGDGDSEYYIELDDATNELWTVSGSYTFENQNENLRCSNGSLSVSSQSTTWSYSNNRLYYRSSGGSGGPGGSGSSSTYYLRYNNGWTVTNSSSSASSIYFYVPTEVEVEVETETTKTYSVTASDIEHFYTADTTDTETAAITASVTEGAPEGTYSYEILSDEDDIISGDIASDGTITFSGAEGTAQVKVSYSWTEGEGDEAVTYTIWQVIDVTATSPYYTIDLHKQTTDDSGNPAAGDEITETVAIKGVEAGDTYSVWAVVKYHDGTTEGGVDQGDVEDNMIEWTSSDPSVATVDPATGVITFTGKDGTVTITATYLDGNKPSDTITISVTQSQYSVPSDGTKDFPEYPDEGAIRYDKTATAVGNFSETGIAMVELSMTGVPYTTGSEIDVVIMLDMTGSMTTDSISAARASAIAFADQIIKNKDGS